MASHKWIAAAIMTWLWGSAGADQPADAPAAAPAEARIAFSSRNIWNWQVIDDQTLLIQSNSRKWYKAKLLGNCPGLRFVERVGFKPNADDSFDKFSSIEARGGQRCPLVSLTESQGPAKKVKKPPAAALSAKP